MNTPDMALMALRSINNLPPTPERLPPSCSHQDGAYATSTTFAPGTKTFAIAFGERM